MFEKFVEFLLTQNYERSVTFIEKLFRFGDMSQSRLFDKIAGSESGGILPFFLVMLIVIPILSAFFFYKVKGPVDKKGLSLCLWILMMVINFVLCLFVNFTVALLAYDGYRGSGNFAVDLFGSLLLPHLLYSSIWFFLVSIIMKRFSVNFTYIPF